jgi:arylsulfatase
MSGKELTRRGLLKALGVAAAGMAGPAWATEAAKPDRLDRPDIIVIMADDVGYSDVGCYGGEIHTPSIDAIAKRGIRFTQYHSENMCAPTRASLLTGLYHIRGFGKDTVTAAEVLAEAGYHTCMSGKWHVSGAKKDQAPWSRGFKRFFGTLAGCGSFFAPIALHRDGKNAEGEWKKDQDFYYTDAISDNAVRYIEQTPRGKPLFLHVAYTAAHWPLHALPEDIARYKGKYAMGWDELRARRLKRMKELGVIGPDVQLSPRHPAVPAWEDAENKPWQQRRMEVYAAQIESMDRGIGRILEALTRTGRADNAVVMFTIDNGGCHVEYGPKRKGFWLNKTTRDGKPLTVGNLPDVMPGPEDTWQSYGYGWANASNTPFRLFKQYDHQGGIRLPLVVQWPRVIREGGKLTDQLCHIIDVMPTVLDLAGCKYPSEFNGNPITPVDGKSMVPIFRGEQREGHRALFWRFNHGSAVRTGKWKLVREDKEPWELYDMDADPAELNDLAADMPEKVEQLEALWDEWSDYRRPKQARRAKWTEARAHRAAVDSGVP